MLYERRHSDGSDQYRIGDLEGGQAVHEAWQKLTPPRALFLSQAVANSSEELTQLRRPHGWLTKALFNFGSRGIADIAERSLRLSRENESHGDDIAAFLREVDVPVTKIRVERPEVTESSADPIGIVEEAISSRHNFEITYCAIDRDSHESFDQALVRAQEFAGSIKVVPSYPCYEFWGYFFTLGLTRSPITAVGAESSGTRMIAVLRSEQGMDGYDKGSIKSVFDGLLDRLPVARTNSARVLASALAEQELNPSTEFHVLIEALEKLGLPALAAPAGE